MLPWAFRTMFWLAGRNIDGFDGNYHLTPPRPGGPAENLVLRLEGFEGPMDLLLDLARVAEGGSGEDLHPVAGRSVSGGDRGRQAHPPGTRGRLAGDGRVADLAEIPPAGAGRRATTTWKSGEMAAEALAERLREMNVIRTLAAWLAARPVLGQDVFARGAPESHHEYDRSRIVIEAGPFVRAYLEAIRRGTKSSHLHAAPADPVDGAGRAAPAGGSRRQPAGLDARWSSSCPITWTARPNAGPLCPARCWRAWRWRAAARSGCGRRKPFGPILVRRGTADVDQGA